MINVVKFNDEWHLTEDTVGIGSVKGVTYREAVDVFAANRPDLALALDELACDDLCGEAGRPQRASATRHDAPRQASEPGQPKAARGSGARFRALYDLGKTNAEALAIVRQEFPQSKAGLSDAAWNRARWKKDRAALVPELHDSLEDLL